MTISELQKAVHALARDKGWWDDRNLDDPAHIAAALCLVHSEVSEALECVRHGEIVGTGGRLEGLPTELADVVIRVLDLAAALGFDLEREIKAKHAYNATRPHRHGGKRL